MVLIVYPAPGPMVEDAAGAAEAVPGIGLLVQSSRNERTRENSALVAKYWPGQWSADALFYQPLLKELKQSGYSGAWTLPADAELTPEKLAPLNAAKDVVDWYQRYYEPPEPGTYPRDYSRMISLNGALVFEVSLRYGVMVGGDGAAVPTLGGSAVIYRADTMKEMWRHSEVVQDASGARNIDDFKANIKELAPKIEKLMPQLAHALAVSLHTRSSRLEGVPLGPETRPAAAAPSSSTLMGAPALSTQPAAGFPPAAAPVGVSTPAAQAPFSLSPFPPVEPAGR